MCNRLDVQQVQECVPDTSGDKGTLRSVRF